MKNLLLLIILYSFSFTATAQNNRTQNVKTLLEVSGAGDAAVQTSNLMLKNFKKQLPNVPDEFWADLMKSFNASKIIDLVTPIYEKHYSDADIQELIAFYQSPIGKKMVAAAPMIMQESYAVGQKWGEEIGTEWVKKLKEKGYLQ